MHLTWKGGRAVNVMWWKVGYTFIIDCFISLKLDSKKNLLGANVSQGK